MPPILTRRLAADIDGPFVLFLIGMRINRIWKPGSWMPTLRAMPRMIAELEARPDLGLLHARMQIGFPNLMMIQYWRSRAHLLDYAGARDSAHLPAWRDFNKRIGASGDVGIWHETYLIAPDAYESIYVGMPPFGLGKAGRLHEATGHRATARRRLGEAEAAPGDESAACPPA